MRRSAGRITHLLVAIALIVPATGLSSPASAAEYLHLVGSLHEHSGYSDGWPGTTPATYFARAKAEGLDFLGSAEHSDNALLPVTFSEGCADPALVVSCIGTDLDSLRKWDATLEQARAVGDGNFTGFRGFEWTSDRFGHISVYFSRHDTNAKIDGGYITMDTFWNWFGRPTSLLGGADGLGVFNHPGAKKLLDEPANNWNDFAYVPEADDRMVGIEVYNDDDEFGTTQGPAEGYYVHALDKGWHVGAVGAEDLHGIPGDRDDYGASRWAKTVILAPDRSEASLRAAMLQRRFYAIRRNDGLRLDFTVDGSPMGSRLARAAGQSMDLEATTNRPGVTVEIVTSGGDVVDSGTGAVSASLTAQADQRYYFMRVSEGGEYIGYSSPIWVSAHQTASVGEWLAGDLHVHTCYSHDAYCPPDDDNTGPEEFYTLSAPVSERFLEASLRGLDYLAITDHNDVRSVTDPGFGAFGVIGIPGYENSLSGHAQMLGADHIYDNGSGSAADVNALADELRADGGVFQVNHAGEGLLTPLDENCSDTSQLDWSYGFDVIPDTVEVWNISYLHQPPLPSGSSNDDAVKYWECMLDRGHRIGATGGSDSHWLVLSLPLGPGNPTTWAFATERSRAGVLQALKDGRTTVSLLPPILGDLRLLLEADADGDGNYEAMIGDDVPPGSRMRVRAEGLLGAGFVQVRANSQTLLDQALVLPGQTVDFVAPSEPGWVRATLSLPDAQAERKQLCDPLVGTLTTYCRNKLLLTALTSPIYLAD